MASAREQAGHAADSGATREIAFGGETLTLTGGRAIWWASQHAVLIADVHLGKPASFRARGAPVPEDVTRRDLERISALLDRFAARRLVILGDLAHDRAAWEPRTLDRFLAWRGTRGDLEITLVRGNHDRWADDPPTGLGIGVVEPGWVLGSLAMHHEPPAEVTDAPTATRHALCGHVHPAVRLRPSGRSTRGSMRAPCYWFSDRLGMLPAFGTFTGCAVVQPRTGDRVFAVGDGVVSGPCAGG